MAQPYHQSIIPSLERVFNEVGLSTLGFLIADTLLPHDHDKVLAVWQAACVRVYGDDYAVKHDFGQVVSHIAAEKERVTKEAAAKAASASTQIETAVPVCPHCHRAMFLAGKSYRCDCITHH